MENKEVKKDSNIIFFDTSSERQVVIKSEKGDIGISYNSCNISKAIEDEYIDNEEIYPEIYNGVDILYRHNGDIIESEIIIKERESIKEEIDYQMFIGENKVNSNDNELILSSSKGKVLTILSPYIEDASYNQNHDVALYVEEDIKDRGILNLKIKLDKEYLLKEDINYPVRVNVTYYLNHDDEMSQNEEEIEGNKDIIYDFESKEIIVRKKVGGFVERLLMNLGYDIDHKEYKRIIYREKEIESELEYKIKNYYDSFVYLIEDYNNSLTYDRLMKFYYLISGKIIALDKIKSIVDYFKNIEEENAIKESISLSMYAYRALTNEISESDNFITSSMLINYGLVRNNISCIQINKRDFEEYVTCRELYLNGNKEKLEIFIKKMIEENKYQEKEYYSELKELTYSDVKVGILSKKEELIERYKVKKLYLFGSFSQEEERIDSDIDVYVVFTLDETYDEILEASEYIRDTFYKMFNRYIDVNVLKGMSSLEKKIDEFNLKEIF